MIKRSVFESSEGPRTDVTYSDLTLQQVDRRIGSYEKKYRMPFSRYKKQFSCDDAVLEEVSDFLDWDNLVQEKAERLRRVRKQPSFSGDRAR